LPVYNLIDGEFSGEIAELDSKYFNQALRRDIVSRVFHYFNTKGIKKTHVAKTVADVQGSGRKPVP
jgi:ribosomal protein L4